jgi:Asp-tRNA(Asn)/Glu-tRNA(Gln) amidotransferase A subunit family amidase
MGALVVVAVLAAPAAAQNAPGAVPLPGLLAPYYTELDLTRDTQVTQEDLDLALWLLGETSDSPRWKKVAAADTDGDGVLTLRDIADLAQRMVYNDGPFKLVEASALDMQAALNAGVTTSVAITQAYLDRIAAYDRVPIGSRPLYSIISGNSQALATAAAMDAERAAQGPRSVLAGVPVIVKDNYNTTDAPTTAGCGCWDANLTATDATMVEGLRADGAIILAKSSLDEYAFGFVSEFSSFLPSGSTRLVASPYDLPRTAGGSSGGTGAAIAANLGGIGFGTDTGGSIRVPSSYNQLVGVRPTVGLASRDGIIPLALSQDTGGPMTRSVFDAAVALDAVTGVDAADPITASQEGKVPVSYTQFLEADALEGARIGYVASMRGTNRTTTRLFDQAVAKLQSLGATVFQVTPPSGLNAVLNEASGSTNEFKHDLDLYIAQHLAPAVPFRTLLDIANSGRIVPSRRNTYIQRNNVTPAQYEAWAGPAGSHTLALANGKQLVHAMLDADDLDALIYPSANPYSTQGTNLRLSPNTGMPAVTVPMGQAIAADTTILGAGVNLEFLGRDFDEGPLLGLAYAYEQATKWRTSPALFPELVPAPPEPAPGTDPTYTVTAAPSTVQVGDTVEVTVAASGLAGLYAYELTLDFDPKAFVYESAVAGTTGTTVVDKARGSVRMLHTRLGSSPATNGDADVATVTLRAIGRGETTVSATSLTSIAKTLETSTTPAVGSTQITVVRRTG